MFSALSDSARGSVVMRVYDIWQTALWQEITLPILCWDDSSLKLCQTRELPGRPQGWCLQVPEAAEFGNQIQKVQKKTQNILGNKGILFLDES